MKPKVLVIVGPTASGKSDLAVDLALKFNGEVISADSRQVYRGLDIGTGKISPSEMRGVRHHLLSITDPHDRYTVADWKTAAAKAITDISARKKLPIICGGTGFYIDALLNGADLPDIEIDKEKQVSLELRPVADLFEELQRIDPRRAGEMRRNGSYLNARRLVRAILIAQDLGRVPELSTKVSPYVSLTIGIMPTDAELRTRIERRLAFRLGNGMIEEARRLVAMPPDGDGLSHERMKELGLEYRYLSEHIEGKLDLTGLQTTLAAKIWQYSKRQKTWWKKNASIKWLKLGDLEAAEELVRVFLTER